MEKSTASDYVNIKNYIMGSKGLNEQAKSNADVNSDGKNNSRRLCTSKKQNNE